MSSRHPEDSEARRELKLADQLDRICDRFETAWLAGEAPLIEDYIQGVDQPLRSRLLKELVALEVDYRQQAGEMPVSAEYLSRFPNENTIVLEVLGESTPASLAAEVETQVHDSRSTPSGHLQIRCPSCQTPMQVAVDTSLTDLACESCGSHFSLVDQSDKTCQAPPLSQLGRFELTERLGVGGFGSVWKGRDKELDRTVAIKIPRQGSMSPEEQERFFQEARAAAQLRHPNIVAIHEVGREGDSVYIVSDFVRGVTLDDWLTGQQLTSREAAELCAKIADALHHAHEAGVVHRDLKPGNILIDGNMEPHLVDFGLARREVGEVTITADGQVLGTPAYMSPEQARGEAHQADRRSDVYSLGVILFQLLTGERPFRGNARMLVHQVLNDEPPSPRKLNANVSRDLETIALKCLEKDPGKRYQTARDVADELRRYLAAEPIQARPLGIFARGWRWSRRNPVVAGLAAAIVCLLVMATLVAMTAAARFMVLSEEREEALIQAEHEKGNAIIAQEQAEETAEQNRRQLYASRINLSHQAWQEGDVARAMSLLENLRPEAGQSDLRGFEWYYLWRLCHSEKHTFCVEDCAMHTVAFSPDGCLVAAAGDKAVIRLWDTISGAEQLSLTGHTGEISAIAFAPGGEVLASAGTDKSVRLWDYVKGVTIAVLQGHDQEVSCLAFSPDGLTLAAGTGVLNFRDGNPLTRYVREPETTEGTAILWNVASQKMIASFEAHKGDVLSLQFSPDGSRLVTGGADRMAKVWQVASKAEQPLLLLEHGDPVISVDFSVDGQTIATGDWRGFLRLWNASNGTQRITVDAHTGPIMCVRFSHDGQSLVTTGHDQRVRLWDADSGEEKSDFRGHTKTVYSADFSPDSSLLATAGMDGAVKLWDVRSRQEFDSLYDAGGNEPPQSYTLDFSPDGKLLVSAARFVEVWNFATGAKVRTLGDVPDGDLSVVFSPDGKTLAAAGSKGVVKVWDTTSWKLKANLTGHPGRVWSLAYSPDGSILATGGFGGIIKFWDVAALRERRTLDAECDHARSVCFSPEDHVLAAACSSSTERGGPCLRRWEVETGHELEPIGRSSADWLAFSPDGRAAASASWDGTVKLWQVDPPHQIALLRGHKDVVYSGAFAPDGKTLATAGWDGTVRLWHVATGQELLALRGATGLPVWCVAFAPNGSSLVMGNGFIQSGNPVGEIAIYRAEKPSPP